MGKRHAFRHPRCHTEAMLMKRLALVGAGVAIVLACGALVLDGLSNGSAEGVAGAKPGVSAEASPTASSVPGTSTPSGSPTSTPRGSDEAASSPTGPAATTPAGPQADAAAPRVLEVPQPVSSGPVSLPAPEPLKALVSSPLPDVAVSQGKIVDGFPTDVVVLPVGTTVITTGVASSDGVLQATADGIVAVTPEQLLAHFQQSLLPLGFVSTTAPSGQEQQALALTRGNDSVNVTTSVTGTGSTRFTLLANLHTEPEA